MNCRCQCTTCNIDSLQFRLCFDMIMFVIEHKLGIHLKSHYAIDRESIESDINSLENVSLITRGNDASTESFFGRITITRRAQS